MLTPILQGHDISCVSVPAADGQSQPYLYESSRGSQQPASSSHAASHGPSVYDRSANLHCMRVCSVRMLLSALNC